MNNEYDTTPTSTFEKIMRSMIDGTTYTGEPRSVMEALLLELNEKIKHMASAMKPAGNKEFSELGVPSEETVGLIYNITDNFTTNQYFIDGAGDSYPAGTGVYGIINIDETTGEETYWWDIFGGAVDLSNYVSKDMIGAANGVAGLDENGSLDFEDAGIEVVSAQDLEDMWDATVPDAISQALNTEY